MKYADMPQMPLEAAALFTAMAEGMGMRASDLTIVLGVPGTREEATRIVRRWSTGVRTIPVPIYDVVADLYEYLQNEVDRRCEAVEAAQSRGEKPVLTTYATPNQLRAAEPDLAYQSLAFHRAILLRVWENTEAPIVYAERNPGDHTLEADQ